MQNRVLSMIGLAARSGHVVSGEFSTEKAVKDGKARLVIVATDASENTRKKFQNMTDWYKVPFILYGSREELGAALGKEYRASLAVTDENLAKAVKMKMDPEKLNNGGNN